MPGSIDVDSALRRLPGETQDMQITRFGQVAALAANGWLQSVDKGEAEAVLRYDRLAAEVLHDAEYGIEGRLVPFNQSDQGWYSPFPNADPRSDRIHYLSQYFVAQTNLVRDRLYQPQTPSFT